MQGETESSRLRFSAKKIVLPGYIFTPPLYFFDDQRFSIPTMNDKEVYLSIGNNSPSVTTDITPSKSLNPLE
jgi:hypothetical protein